MNKERLRPRVFFYRVLQKLARLKGSSRQTSGQTDSVACVVWPPVHTENDLHWLHRWVSWYIPPQTQLRVTILVGDGLSKDAQKRDFAVNVTLQQWPIQTRQFDAILLRQMRWSEALRAVCLFDGQVQTIDREFWDVEESLAFEHLFRIHRTKSLSALQERLATISRKNYAQLFQTYQGSDRAFVFGTGPSLQEAFKLDFRGDELTIVCNSSVKDQAFLDHVRPKILTFADQAFHFGLSDYAATFRRDVISVLHKYQCKCIVPQERALLLALHYPEITDFLIAMPLGSQLNFPTPEVLFVETTENIMSLFMVPVASALANTVYFCGADGRAPQERYFWQYADPAQYQSLLHTVAEWHPSFFRDRHIETYYKKHCQTLERQLAYGEERGVCYVSLTQSYIPALSRRSASDRPGPPFHSGAD